MTRGAGGIRRITGEGVDLDGRGRPRRRSTRQLTDYDAPRSPPTSSPRDRPAASSCWGEQHRQRICGYNATAAILQRHVHVAQTSACEHASYSTRRADGVTSYYHVTVGHERQRSLPPMSPTPSDPARRHRPRRPPALRRSTSKIALDWNTTPGATWPDTRLPLASQFGTYASSTPVCWPSRVRYTNAPRGRRAGTAFAVEPAPTSRLRHHERNPYPDVTARAPGPRHTDAAPSRHHARLDDNADADLPVQRYSSSSPAERSRS